jgi:hypothetical protein
MSQRFLSRKEAGGLAAASADELQSLVKELNGARYDRPLVDRLLTAASKPDQLSPACWDEAAQSYLALVALHLAQGEPDQRGPVPSQAELREVRQQLAFPPGYDSPARFDPTNLDNALRTSLPLLQLPAP